MTDVLHDGDLQHQAIAANIRQCGTGRQPTCDRKTYVFHVDGCVRVPLHECDAETDRTDEIDVDADGGSDEPCVRVFECVTLVGMDATLDDVGDAGTCGDKETSRDHDVDGVARCDRLRLLDVAFVGSSASRWVAVSVGELLATRDSERDSDNDAVSERVVVRLFVSDRVDDRVRLHVRDDDSDGVSDDDSDTELVTDGVAEMVGVTDGVGDAVGVAVGVRVTLDDGLSDREPDRDFAAV